MSNKNGFNNHNSNITPPGADKTRVAPNASKGIEPKTPDSGRTLVYNTAAASNTKPTTAQAVKQFFKDYYIPVIIVAAIAVVSLVVALILPSLMGGWHGKNIGAAGSWLTSTSSQSNSTDDDENYDPNDNVIDVDKYPDTVLGTSERAGDDYIKDTLFIGDSNTVRMLAYRDVTKVGMENCIGYEGMGITSFSSLKFVQFKMADGSTKTVSLPEAIKLMQPQRVLINFGTNNGTMSVDSFISSYEDAINAVEESYPYADIIIASIFPIDKYNGYGSSVSQKRIDEFNAGLVKLANERELKFLNWSEAIKDPETGYCQTDCTVQDGIHISQAGMKKLFDYFLTHSYIAEDRRPTPLNAIPERLGNIPNLITGDPTKIPGLVTSSDSETELTVSISAYNSSDKKSGGGSISYGGEQKQSHSFAAEAGDVLSGISAVAEDGFEFSHWSVNIGSISDTSSKNMPNFTVPDTTENIVITANFIKKSSVPSLIGLNFDNGAATAEGWTVRLLARKFDPTAKGTVIAQTPTEGSTLNSNDDKIISVTVSDGPGATIPSYTVGSTGAQALVDSLKSAGFKSVSLANGSTTTDSAKGGKVEAINYPAGSTLSVDTAITVTQYVYQEPVVETVTIPPISGSFSDYKAALEALGLSVSGSAVSEGATAENNQSIISVNPGAGTAVEKGSAVTITYYNYTPPVDPLPPEGGDGGDSTADGGEGNIE